jgi:hypothetical protein
MVFSLKIQALYGKSLGQRTQFHTPASNDLLAQGGMVESAVTANSDRSNAPRKPDQPTIALETASNVNDTSTAPENSSKTVQS